MKSYINLKLSFGKGGPWNLWRQMSAKKFLRKEGFDIELEKFNHVVNHLKRIHFSNLNSVIILKNNFLPSIFFIFLKIWGLFLLLLETECFSDLNCSFHSRSGPKV